MATNMRPARNANLLLCLASRVLNPIGGQTAANRKTVMADAREKYPGISKPVLREYALAHAGEDGRTAGAVWRNVQSRA